MNIGRFKAIKNLGEGAEGYVYLCWDANLEREVAIKLVTGMDDNEDYSEQIISEARMVAKIANPYVIPIFEVGMIGSMPYLVFEYIKGMTLTEHLKTQGKLAENDALMMLTKLAKGLESAHVQDIMHLDLSPGNILLDQVGNPRIMDFGLAQVNSAMDKSHQVVKGTPRYLSPEHLSDSALTPATDIYALGLIFYEMLTGTPAIAATQIGNILDDVKTSNINWQQLQQQHTSAEVIALLRDMLQTDPGHRYENAAKLVNSLSDIAIIRQQRHNGNLTLEFLLRRLQRRPEFPACSHNIAEINRLTDEESNSSFSELGGVIIRDYSLTNRMMKIANSVIFDRGNGKANSLSQAIARLGLRLVRMICNGMLLFDQVSNRDEQLKDTLVMSFVAGLLARHIVKSIQPGFAEEAFICALFHRLGTHLLVFYLPDEYEDISRLISEGMERQQAEQKILSTTAEKLGRTIASKWNFPDTILDCMKTRAASSWHSVERKEDILLYATNFSNQLCELILNSHEQMDVIAAIDEFLQCYELVIKADTERMGRLLRLVADKFTSLAPDLGINCQNSEFFKQLDKTAKQIEHFYQSQQIAATL